jgi:CPA1 family monovalent cation:H+ antiporter
MQSILSTVTVLLVLAAAFGFVNSKLLRLPRSIGILVLAVCTSALLIGIDAALPQLGIREWARGYVGASELPDLFLNGILAFLLFAGALEVSLTDLWQRKFTVLALSTVGVVLATALMGFGMAVVFRLLGLQVPLLWCLILGAVTAPTDPVAVLGALERVGLSGQLRAVIAGESLFNDGVAVVIFLLLVGLTTPGVEMGAAEVALLFLREALGGVGLGLATGYLAYRTMRRIDDYNVELMISLALVMATATMARLLDVSSPIAIVVAGLLIGNYATRYAMSDRTRAHLGVVWSVVDDILNALLFLLVGLQFLVLDLSWGMFVVGLLAIALAFVARLVSVGTTVLALYGRHVDGAAFTILIWAGLRGGVSVALALSLPVSPYRDIVLAAAYAVVLFTVLAQGLSLAPLARRLFPPVDPKAGQA